MSGSMPFAWIERPDGVKYRAEVNRNAPLSAPNGMMVRDSWLRAHVATSSVWPVRLEVASHSGPNSCLRDNLVSLPVTAKKNRSHGSRTMR